MIEHYKDDISTIFSIVPFAVREFKPGLYPGSFNIEPCLNDKDPQLLKIGASEHLMSVGGRKDPALWWVSAWITTSSIATWATWR